MFRALAKGLAYNQGMYLSGQAETDDADELRMAVFDAICGKDTAKRNVYKDAMVAIRAQFDLNQYGAIGWLYLCTTPPLTATASTFSSPRFGAARPSCWC